MNSREGGDRSSGAVDIVAEFDEDGDLYGSEIDAETPAPSSLFILQEPPASFGPQQKMLRQAKLARFIFDCKKVDGENFAGLLKRGLELFGRTEVDVVKIFAIRLERAEAWTFGSEVPLPQMRDGVVKWLVGLAETEIDNQGADRG